MSDAAPLRSCGLGVPPDGFGEETVFDSIGAVRALAAGGARVGGLRGVSAIGLTLFVGHYVSHHPIERVR